jgi:hypothetical protein
VHPHTSELAARALSYAHLGLHLQSKRHQEEDGGEDAASEEESYFLAKIHDARFYRTVQLRVEYRDWPDEKHWTWEPVSHFPNNKEEVAAFKAKWEADGKEWPASKRRLSKATRAAPPTAAMEVEDQAGPSSPHGADDAQQAKIPTMAELFGSDDSDY